MKIETYTLKPTETGCLIGVSLNVNGKVFEHFYDKNAAIKARSAAHRISKCLDGTGITVTLKEFPYFNM